MSIHVSKYGIDIFLKMDFSLHLSILHVLILPRVMSGLGARPSSHWARTEMYSTGCSIHT